MNEPNKGEILIYQSEEGQTKIDVLLENESLWLTQQQLADLFQTTKQNISLHTANIFSEGELAEEATVKEYLTVRREGNRDVRRQLAYYNLDVIISIGYRVKSHIATNFRIWATERLREYLIKGFAMDDERLKQARNGYFDELLGRIRDIRSSEKVFYRKISDIYATSVDYDGSSDFSKEFFATVQNKFHYAITGNTAAEIIKGRADATKKDMGLTNYPGDGVRKQDVATAKNYLNEDELETLNLIVSQYLDFAELQARRGKPMHMKDWMDKLHGFLTLNEQEILTHKGLVSKKAAKTHAEKEYGKFRQQLLDGPDELDKAIKRLGKSNDD
jgi:hypothetical protein